MISRKLLRFIFILIALGCTHNKNPVNYDYEREWQFYRIAKLLYTNADGVNVLDLKSKRSTLLAKNGERIDYPPRSGEVRSSAGEARWSLDGKRIVYVEENSGTDYSQITVMNADGSNKRTIVHEGNPFRPSWSPDSSEIVYTKSRLRFIIFIINADGTNERQLTNLPGKVSHPSFSRDGQKIIFTSTIIDSGYSKQLFMMNRDGSDVEQLTYPTELLKDAGGASWSPVSDEIVFSGKDGKEPDKEIYLLKLSDRHISKLTDRKVLNLDIWYNNVFSSWSNDGRYIMYSKHSFGLSSGPRPLPSVWGMKPDGSGQKQIIENAQHPDLYVQSY